MLKQLKHLSCYLSLLIFAFSLVACGGGGSTPPPTDPNTLFQTFPSGFFTPGYSTTLTFTGTDNAGGVYSGTLSRQTQAQTTFLGQPAIEVLDQLQLMNSANGASISAVGFDYFTTSATDRHYLGFESTSEVTVAATTSPIPQTVMIGDIGVIGIYTNNAGEVDTQSYRVDAGTGGNAKRVLLSTTVDQFGTLLVSETQTTTIDANGKQYDTEIILFFADVQITMTLNGNYN